MPVAGVFVIFPQPSCGRRCTAYFSGVDTGEFCGFSSLSGVNTGEFG
eukprot:COSAG01_NODE_66960_length_268_cov_0.923077_1_plen_46_part_01